MKKFSKAVIAMMTAAALGGALVGCGEKETTTPPPVTTNPTTTAPQTTNPPAPAITTSYGVGYGLVHGAGYVARASILLDGDDILDVAWDEACLPTYVQAEEGTPADDVVVATVVDHGSEVQKTFYKTVKFGDFTAIYNAETNSYEVDGVKLTDWLQTEANAQAYFDAVFASRLAVVVNGEEDTTVLDALSLLKSHNGYWKGAQYPLGYRGNYDKTVAYLIENGLEAAKTLEKDGTWIDANNVDTGATWTDLNSDKEGTLSYVQLVELAASHAETAEAANAYGLVHGAGYVGGATVVLNEKGELVDVAWDEACLPTQVQAAEGTPADDVVVATVVDHGSEVQKSYYKTVKFGGVTAIYNAETTSYEVDGVKLTDWLQTEANAQTYFNAVKTSTVSVVVGGAEDTTVLTAATLMKTQNGYWLTGKLGYWGNYGKTVEYLRTYGLEAAKTLEKDGTWIDGNNVDTGATWTDLNSDKEGTLSYVQLVTLAASKLA